MRKCVLKIYPSKIIRNSSIGLSILLLSSLNAKADLQSLYGLGSSSAALVGANRTKPTEAFMSSYNPAVLAEFPDSTVSFGWQGSYDHFDKLKDVVIDNETIGGSNTNNRGNVDTNVDDTNVAMVSAAFRLHASKNNKTLGLNLAIPTQKVLGVETQSSYYPQYAMYFADTQRMMMNFAYGWKYSDTLSVGLGIHMYLVTGSTVRSVLPATDPSDRRTSNLDVKLEVKPSVAPSFGMIKKFDYGNTAMFSYIGERDAKLALDSRNAVNVLSASPIPVNFNGSSSLYYDPEIFSLSYNKAFLTWDYFLTVDFERWSKFAGSNVIMKFDADTSFEQIVEDTRYNDIFAVRTGSTFYGSHSEYNVGLGYRPSPVPRPTGNTNFLDADKIMLGLGYTRELQPIEGFTDKVSNLSFHVQGHYLIPKKVTKTDNTLIGSPGYTMEGFVVSYGISYSMNF
jgi:hypothetical protein